MTKLSESQTDFIIRHRVPIAIAGIGIMLMPFAFGFRFGLLSGLMLFSLGTYCFFFRNWRSEPGVWMLAALLGVFLGPCWLHFEILSWRAILAPPLNPNGRAASWNQIRLFVDASVALVMFGTTMKLLVTVGFENWKRTHNIRQRFGTH